MKIVNERNVEIENRLTSLETRLEDLITNHLPHLESKIDRIQWLLVTTMIALVINLANKLL